MITPEDVTRLHYPELQYREIEERRIRHLAWDLIEWVLSDISPAYMAIFSVLIFMVILFWK